MLFDTTSRLLGCDKKTVWAAWNSILDLTNTLVVLIYDPDSFSLNSVFLQWIECFIVHMYSRVCGVAGVNDGRQVAEIHPSYPMFEITAGPEARGQ
jgi:hypothetical protein